MRSISILFHKVRKYKSYLIRTYLPGQKLVRVVRGYIYNPYHPYLLTQPSLLLEVSLC
jgi:hypothetical protein